jgi:hypothetical protein
MSFDNQCSSNLQNKRCTNKTLGNSLHCVLHHKKALSLYNKYKKLSEEVKKLDFNKVFDDMNNHITYLLSAYSLLNNTFDARMKHRTYAFAPECYDAGHDYQFIYLNKLINQCETILADCYNKLIVPAIEEKITKTTKGPKVAKPTKVTKAVTETIKECRQKRQQKQDEWDDYLNQYIEENQIILKRKYTMINLIVTQITKLYNEVYMERYEDINIGNNSIHDSYDSIENSVENSTEDIEDDLSIPLFVQGMVLFQIVLELYHIDYFEKHYKPSQCAEPSCKCYIPYTNIRLMNKNDVGCGVLEHYFNVVPEDVLKKFYEILLLQKNKITPLINDIYELYEKYYDNILFMNHAKLKRLVFMEDTNQKQELSCSEIFAQSRLKNKYFYRLQQQEYLVRS